MVSRLQTYFSWLTSDPVGFIVYMLYFVAAVLISLILHEISHGYMAWRCGDPTARMLGRLSLDPRKHLDPIGTVCMFLLGIGWAKPVPVNPRNFRSFRRDDFLVSIAGITTNLTIFIICTALSVVVNRIMVGGEFYAYYSATVEDRTYLYTNMSLIVQSGFLPEDLAVMCAHPWLQYVQRFLVMLQQINLSLAVFNLLPIPPLDGYHLLNDTLLRGRLQLNGRMHQITHTILIVLCLSGALSSVLSVVNDTIMDAVVNLFMLI